MAEIKRISKKDLDSLIPRLLDNEHGEIPCLSTTLRRLMVIDPDSDASIQELAEIILEDYGLINKVLQVVNSSYYRRLNTEVTTVTQAVIFLGFNTVRSIAADMAMLDLLPGKNSNIAIQVMAEAFLAANIAYAITEHDRKIDTEAVFVASLYRLTARILTVLQEPELYSRLCEMEKTDKSTDKMLVRNFFREIGYRLSEMWSIPPVLTGYMEGCRQFSPSVDPKQLELVRSSCMLSHLVLRKDPGHQINDVLQRFQANLDMERSTLVDCLETALAMTKKKSKTLKAVLENVEINRLVNLPAGKSHRRQPENKNEKKISTEEKNDKEELFLELLNQITQAILEDKLTVDQVLLLAVEIVQRSLDPANVALCLFTPDRKMLAVRYALGKHAGFIKTHLSLSNPLNRPLLKMAFQENTEITGMWNQIIPDGGQDIDTLRANQLCASPIMVKSKALGCFLVDFRPGTSIDGKK